MIKDTLNYKLINILITLLIILVIYITKDLWINIYKTIINIIKPITISIMISYVFKLYLKKLNKTFNKKTSTIILIITILISLIIVIGILITTTKQITECINTIYYFIKKYILKNNIDILNYMDELKKLNIITNILSVLYSSPLKRHRHIVPLFSIIASISICKYLKYRYINFENSSSQAKEILRRCSLNSIIYFTKIFFDIPFRNIL